MILVVGLGNPGNRYADNRHNAGFMVVDELVARWGGPLRERFRGEFGLVEVGGVKAGLLKPTTFMNESGQAVQAAAAFYRLSPAEILVVHDELDLPFGALKLKQGGGDAGHNGLKSVTGQLGGGGYNRLRIGIGRPPPMGGEVVGWVLSAFSANERPQLSGLMADAADCVGLVLQKGLSEAMNRTNQRARPEPRGSTGT